MLSNVQSFSILFQWILECGLVFVEKNLRIINGAEAVPHSWPAQVMVVFNYYVANFSITHPNSTEDTIFLNASYSYYCGGTLLDKWTVMTSSGCILKSFVRAYDNHDYIIPVEPNEFFPTYESCYTVYLGLHNIYDIKDNLVQNRLVRKIIKV